MAALHTLADGLTYYLRSCQGGNRRQPPPQAPAHHWPVHNKFFPAKLSRSQLSPATIRSNYSWIAKCWASLEGRRRTGLILPKKRVSQLLASLAPENYFRKSCSVETEKFFASVLEQRNMTDNIGQRANCACMAAASYILLLKTLVIIFTKHTIRPFIFLLLWFSNAAWVWSFLHPWRSVLNDP